MTENSDPLIIIKVTAADIDKAGSLSGIQRGCAGKELLCSRKIRF